MIFQQKHSFHVMINSIARAILNKHYIGTSPHGMKNGMKIILTQSIKRYYTYLISPFYSLWNEDTKYFKRF